MNHSVEMHKGSKKNEIKIRLNQLMWEIEEIREGEIWWEDESWKIVCNYNQDLCLYLTFLVDPLFEGKIKRGYQEARKKGQGINEIIATEKVLENRVSDYKIASIYMTDSTRFKEELDNFIEAISDFKRVKEAKSNES